MPVLRLKLDLAINPVVAVRLTAIDLPGSSHDESGMMCRLLFLSAASRLNLADNRSCNVSHSSLKRICAGSAPY
jgi:hypothetical protein